MTQNKPNLQLQPNKYPTKCHYGPDQNYLNVSNPISYEYLPTCFIDLKLIDPDSKLYFILSSSGFFQLSFASLLPTHPIQGNFMLPQGSYEFFPKYSPPHIRNSRGFPSRILLCILKCLLLCTDISCQDDYYLNVFFLWQRFFTLGKVSFHLT